MAEQTSPSAFTLPVLTLDIPNSEAPYTITTFEFGDVEALQGCHSLDAVNNNLIAVPKPYGSTHATSWIEAQLPTNSILALPSGPQRKKAFFDQGGAFPLQVIRYEGRLVGCCSLTPNTGKGDEVVELGYYLHPDHHGKGIMFAAASVLLPFAAGEAGIEKVYASADIMNPASGKVIEKVAQTTAKGEIERGETVMSWPENKVVEGRERESVARFWRWSM